MNALSQHAHTGAAGDGAASGVLNNLGVVRKVKTAAETVTNSTVLQNDNDLFLTLSTTGERWLIEWNLKVYGDSTADIKVELDQVGDHYWVGHAFGLDVSAATSSGPHYSGGLIGFGGVGKAFGAIDPSNVAGGANLLVHAELIATASGTANIMWAQNVANAIGVTVGSGSYMIAYRVF